MSHQATVADRLASVHPRNLRMGCAHGHAAHLAHAKTLAPVVIGPCVAFALQYAGISIKQAADLTGRPLTSVYRWLKGQEQPNLDALWALGAEFQHGLMDAMGRRCAGATVTSTISFQHSPVAV